MGENVQLRSRAVAQAELGLDRVFHVAWARINLYVAYNFSESTWVNFKLFGMLGLTAGVRAGAGVLAGEPKCRRKPVRRVNQP